MKLKAGQSGSEAGTPTPTPGDDTSSSTPQRPRRKKFGARSGPAPIKPKVVYVGGQYVTININDETGLPVEQGDNTLKGLYYRRGFCAVCQTDCIKFGHHA